MGPVATCLSVFAACDGFCRPLGLVACSAYVLVAWIWSFAFYLLLDPLKWIMAYIMNEDGFRSQGRWKAANRKRGAARRREAGEKSETVPGHMDQVNAPSSTGSVIHSSPRRLNQQNCTPEHCGIMHAGCALTGLLLYHAAVHQGIINWQLQTVSCCTCPASAMFVFHFPVSLIMWKMEG